MHDLQTVSAITPPQRESPIRRLVFFVLACAYLWAILTVIDLATAARAYLDLPRLSQWNWFGKVACILFSGLLLVCFPWLRRNVGLRWHQAAGSARLSIGCFVGYLICAAALGLLQPPLEFSADTLLFQGFMPGIDEELMMRGIALALFERAFGHNPMSCRLRFGLAGCLTALYFGLAHGISTDAGQWQFSWLLFLTTTAWCVPATLVRTRSGSLLWPVIYHGVWNGTIFLIPMLR